MLDDNKNYCAQKGEKHESKNIKTPFLQSGKYDRIKEKERRKNNNWVLLLPYEYGNLTN